MTITLRQRFTTRRRLLAGAAATLLASRPGGAAPPARTFDLQGHRGARGLAPENTLPSFELALRHGASTLELDVAVTRDGVLVVHHDLALNPDVARDAHGRWLAPPVPPIHSLTWDQLQTYDVGRLKPGSRYAAQHPQQQPIDGTRIPRLADVFALVQRAGHEHVRLAIETKLSPLQPDATLAPQPFATAVVDAVRQAGLERRVQILSFDWRTLQVVQRIAPPITTVCLTAQQRWLDNVRAQDADGSPWTAGVQWREHRSVPKMVKAAGGRVWSAYHGELDAEQVGQAHALGLQVLAWTVNDAPTIGRMIDLGVDGLVTDRVDVARGVLDARGLKPG
jgi:glycerophosphoryl diester phosphodiesterase